MYIGRIGTKTRFPHMGHYTPYVYVFMLTIQLAVHSDLSAVTTYWVWAAYYTVLGQIYTK